MLKLIFTPPMMIALLLTLAFIACEKEDAGMADSIANLEREANLQALGGFLIKNASPEGHVVYKTCESEGNQESILSYKTVEGAFVMDSAGVPDSIKAGAHYKQGQGKFVEFGEAFHKVKSLLKVESFDGTMNCGASMAFTLRDGAILVKSKVNMDNLYGFQYKRKVLAEDWALYKIK